MTMSRSVLTFPNIGLRWFPSKVRPVCCAMCIAPKSGSSSSIRKSSLTRSEGRKGNVPEKLLVNRSNDPGINGATVEAAGKLANGLAFACLGEPPVATPADQRYSKDGCRHQDRQRPPYRYEWED